MISEWGTSDWALAVVCVTFGIAIVVSITAGPSHALPVGVAASEGASMGDPGSEVVVYADVEPSKGDVVLLDAGDRTYNHRLIKQTKQGWVTKGDANTVSDQSKMAADPAPYGTTETIYGVVILSIPIAWLSAAAASLILTAVVLRGWRYRQNVLDALYEKAPSRRVTIRLVVVLFVVFVSLGPVAEFNSAGVQPSVQPVAAGSTTDAILADFEDGSVEGFSGGGNVEQGYVGNRSFYVQDTSTYTKNISLNDDQFEVRAIAKAPSGDDMGPIELHDTQKGVIWAQVFGDQFRLYVTDDNGNVVIDQTFGSFSPNHWYEFNVSVAGDDIRMKVHNLTGDGSVYSQSTTSNITFNNAKLDAYASNEMYVDKYTICKQFGCDLSNYSLAVSNAAPSTQSKLQSRQVQLSADVNSSIFNHNETLAVQFVADPGTPQERVWYNNVTKNTTVSVTKYFNSTGPYGEETRHDWTVVIWWKGHPTTKVDSDQDSFQVPGRVEFYNRTGDNQKLTGYNFSVQTFLPNQSIDTRTVNGSGGYNLTGLGNVGGWTIITEERGTFRETETGKLYVYDNHNVYLKHETVNNTVPVKFILDDNTGRYSPSNTTLLIKSNINGSYRLVGGGAFGSTNEVNASLILGDTYSLIVRNNDGDRRVVGTYSPPPGGETTTIVIDSDDVVLPPPANSTDYTYNITKNQLQNDKASIVFQFYDRGDQTGDMRVRIYEYGNESNVIYDQEHDGPLGRLTVTKVLSPAQNNMTWVVEATADRNGETIEIREVVGARGDLQLPLDSIVLQVGTVMFIVLMPAMFPGDRDVIGAIVACLVALFGWWLNVLPAGIGVGAIMFGLLIAVWWKSSERRGTVQ